ncbi:MAG: hypothetical protein ACK5MD_01860 [Flavobacteriales bacterium]
MKFFTKNKFTGSLAKIILLIMVCLSMKGTCYAMKNSSHTEIILFKNNLTDLHNDYLDKSPPYKFSFKTTFKTIIKQNPSSLPGSNGMVEEENFENHPFIPKCLGNFSLKDCLERTRYIIYKDEYREHCPDIVIPPPKQ